MSDSSVNLNSSSQATCSLSSGESSQRYNLFFPIRRTGNTVDTRFGAISFDRWYFQNTQSKSPGIVPLDARLRIVARRMTPALAEVTGRLAAAVQESMPTTVVLDLNHVNFVGSVGFLAFLAIRREPSVENIVLCNLDPNVHKLFSICKLIPEGSGSTAPLQIAATIDEAMARYAIHGWTDRRVDVFIDDLAAIVRHSASVLSSGCWELSRH